VERDVGPGFMGRGSLGSGSAPALDPFTLEKLFAKFGADGNLTLCEGPQGIGGSRAGVVQVASYEHLTPA